MLWTWWWSSACAGSVFGRVACFQKSEDVSIESCILASWLSLDMLLLRSALAGLRDVKLDVQILWHAQHFAELEV